MPSWVIEFILPYAIQALTPVVIAVMKRIAGELHSRLPKPALPILAAAVGEIVNQAGGAIAGVELPPGVAGFVAVGLREFYSQLIAQPTGLETPKPIDPRGPVPILTPKP